MSLFDSAYLCTWLYWNKDEREDTIVAAMIFDMRTFHIFCLCALFSCVGVSVGAPKIHEVAPDGSWTWFNDERAVWSQGKLYAGYVRSDGHICVTRYDSDKRHAAETVLSTWKEQDDHNNPGIFVRPDGRLLIAYATHGTSQMWNFRISKTTDPQSLNDWGEEQSVAPPDGKRFSSGWTYCNPLPGPDGKIFLFGRGIGWNPTYLVSDDQGESWSPPVHLIRHPNRPYAKYAARGNGRIDIAYTEGHPHRVTNSIYHIYLEDGKWRGSDGTVLAGEPPFVPQQGSVVYRYGRTPGTGPAWIWDINYDVEERPVIVHSVRHAKDPDDLRYYYATWDAEAKRWDSREIARAGVRLYESEWDYVGGIALDSNDNRQVFISTAVDPRSGWDTPHREIYRGHLDDSGKWQWTAITENSPADNLRPYVPEKHGHKLCVLWFQGRYTSYTDIRCRVLMALE